MCVPSPQQSAAPASTIPSVASATALDLGGDDLGRGSANLGRLQLRMLGNPSAPSQATTTPQVTPPVTTPTAPTTGSPTAPFVASPGPGSTGYSPNTSLRLAS